MHDSEFRFKVVNEQIQSVSVDNSGAFYGEGTDFEPYVTQDGYAVIHSTSNVGTTGSVYVTFSGGGSYTFYFDIIASVDIHMKVSYQDSDLPNEYSAGLGKLNIYKCHSMNFDNSFEYNPDYVDELYMTIYLEQTNGNNYTWVCKGQFG